MAEMNFVLGQYLPSRAEVQQNFEAVIAGWYLCPIHTTHAPLMSYKHVTCWFSAQINFEMY